MDGFAYGVVASKGEGDVAGFNGMPGMSQDTGGIKKGGGVDSVFFHTGGNGKILGSKIFVGSKKFIN